MPRLRHLLLFALLLCACLAGGCTAKAKAERHLQRGNAFYEKQEFEKARIEYLNAFRNGSRDIELMARLGEMFLKDGNIQAAVSFMVQVRNTQPTNVVVRARLASLLFALGQPQPAKEEAEAILKVDPLHADALTLLADCAKTKEEIDGLRARFGKLMAGSPGDANVAFALGILARKAGELDAAKELYEKAISLDKSKPKFYLALAEVATARGDTNAADASYTSAIANAPVKSWERLRYAEHLVKSQRNDEAEKLLLETVEKAPDFTRALNMLTEVLTSKNKLDEAEKYSAKALALAPADHDALLNRARLKLARRDVTAAIAELESMLKNFPRDPAIHYNLALAHIANTDASKALSSLDTVIGLDPKHVQAGILRGEILLKQGNAAAALPELTRFAGEFPSVVPMQFLLASAYRQRQEFDNALQIYARLAKALPSDPRPSYFAGLCYKDVNKPAEARAAFENALKDNPNFAAALEELVNMDLFENKADAAAALLEPYLQKFKDKPALMLLKAKILVAQRKGNEAIDILKKAVEIEPAFEAAQRALLQLYLAGGKRDEAVSKLTAMIKRNPDDALSQFQLAVLLEEDKDYKAARAHYEQLLRLEDALKFKQENATAQNVLRAVYNNLANILAEHSDELDTAVGYAQKARDLDPNDPRVADTFGWLLWKRGEYDRALPPLQEAAERLPSNPEVLYHLGMAFYMTGAEEPALRTLESALKSKNPFSGKERAATAVAVLKINPATADAAALQLLQKVTAESPKDLGAFLRLAEMHDIKKDWAKADESYQAVLKINPRSLKALSRLAEIAGIHLKNPQRGFDYGKQAWAVSRDGNLAAVIGPLGYMAGDFRFASSILAEAGRAQPDNPRVAFYQGLTAYALGDFVQARDLLVASQAGQAQLPLSKFAADLVSLHLSSAAPTPEIATQVAAALQLDPNFPPAIIASGLVAEQSKDYTKARAFYEQVLKTYPSHIAAQRQLGLLLSEQFSSDQEAQQFLTTAKTAIPGDGAINKALGKIAYRRSDYREAARLLRDASMKLTNDPDLLYHLGMSQYNLKEKQAKDTLDRAIRLDTQSTLPAEARRIVAELK